LYLSNISILTKELQPYKVIEESDIAHNFVTSKIKTVKLHLITLLEIEVKLKNSLGQKITSLGYRVF
jgi:hypothetical protein